MPLSLKSLVALIGLAPLIGCSAFKPKVQDVRIDTNPPGLLVRVDGEDRGRAPVTVSLDRNVSHTIVAGDSNGVYVRELHRKMSTTGKIDMVTGAMFLVPGLGLLTPGAWDLDQTDIMIPLSEIESTQPATRPATTMPVK